ncbi:hypothetical protein [Pseudomonas tolaasii]
MYSSNSSAGETVRSAEILLADQPRLGRLLVAGHTASFNRLPKDVQAVVSKRINTAVLAQRDDLAKLQGTIRDTLKQQGLELVESPPEPFRQRLQSGNYHSDWHEKFGDAGWSILEKYAGKLA